MNATERSLYLLNVARRCALAGSVVLSIVGSLLPSSAHAQTPDVTSISSSVTQTGGIYTVGGNGVLVVDGVDGGAEPTRVFEGVLINGAQAVVVGTGTQGNLLYLGSGTVLNNIGNNTQIATYGGQPVFSGVGYIGLNTSSSGTGTVNNATWTNSQDLHVGYSGTGMLSIAAGTVSNSQGVIGYNSGSHGTVTITGIGSSWTNSQGLYIGGKSWAAGGTGNLTINDSGKVTVGTTTKLWSGGTLSIDGGTLETVNFDRNVGTVNHNHGTLKVTGNYSQTSNLLTIVGNAAGKNPLLHLSKGSGSATTSIIEAVVIGQTGSMQNGKLLIDGGRTVNTTGNESPLTTVDGTVIRHGFGYLGLNAGSTGSATISGTGSSWDLSRRLLVGYKGTGEMTITAHGKVAVHSQTHIGSEPGSTGSMTITGAGSEMNSETTLVGYQGKGTLRIDAQGKFAGNWSVIAGQPNSEGDVTVSGAGTTWTNTTVLRVSGYGTATLLVQDGATITSQNASLGLYYWNANSRGTTIVTGTGSKWTNTQNLYVGGSEFGQGGAGILTVEQGGLIEAGTLKLFATGTLNGGGGTLKGNVQNLGLISPGNSPGTMTIDGNLNTTGRLRLEIASESSFDHLITTGQLTIGGTVEIDLLNGYIPTSGDTFDLLDFSSLVNAGYAFDFSGASLLPGQSWDTSNFLTNGSLTIMAVPEPSTWIIGSLALFGFAGIRLRRKQCDSTSLSQLNDSNQKTKGTDGCPW